MSNIAKIKKYCISNGEGLRTAVFFSGCEHYCKGCFNQELWDYNYGEPFNLEEILSTIDEHTAGLSLLGGDPLCGRNAEAALELCMNFKKLFPNKTIWLWTGFTLEEVKNIYAKYGIEFKDIVWNDKKNEIKQAKVLKHDNKINRP